MKFIFFLLFSARDSHKMPRSPRWDHKALDLPTSRPQNFSRAQSASINFLCFRWQSERDSGIFAMGPTTGSGNGKRRTLRKSIK